MAEIIRSMNLISVFKQEKGVKRFYDDIQHTAYGLRYFAFSYSDMGVDPFTSMNMAISGKSVSASAFIRCASTALSLLQLLFSADILSASVQ